MLALRPSISEFIRDKGPTFFRIVDEGHYLGMVCLHTQYEKGVAEVGYRINEEHQGRGYAKAALALALAEWRKTGWHTIVARVYCTNTASAKVLLANGFTQKEAPLHDRGLEHFLYFERSLDA